MISFIQAGGILMYPILLCSFIAMGIIGERLWTLRRDTVMPAGLVARTWEWLKAGKLDKHHLEALRNGSPLGRILAAGIINRHNSRAMMKESIEEVGAHVIHELGRYLNTLGILASITPLLGLLGTVVGMIDVFSNITDEGVGNAAALAGGIYAALFTTAFGLSVAIPCLIFYRYLRGRVDELVVGMEYEAIRLVDVLHDSREQAKAMKAAKARGASA